MTDVTDESNQKVAGFRNRFWREALEEPYRRRSSRFCALLMLLLEEKKVPEEHKHTVARILVRDGDGSIQQRAFEHLHDEVLLASEEMSKRLAKHAHGAGKNAGICAD